MRYKCRGPAARNVVERALCLQALDELEHDKNVELWKARILVIYARKQTEKPEDRFGGYMDGQWRSVDEIIREYGTEGAMRVWSMWKNERAGCGTILDGTIKRMEYDNLFIQRMFGMEIESPSQEYRVCPKCKDRDPIVLGLTNWDNG